MDPHNQQTSEFKLWRSQGHKLSSQRDPNQHVHNVTKAPRNTPSREPSPSHCLPDPSVPARQRQPAASRSALRVRYSSRPPAGQRLASLANRSAACPCLGPTSRRPRLALYPAVSERASLHSNQSCHLLPSLAGYGCTPPLNPIFRNPSFAVSFFVLFGCAFGFLGLGVASSRSYRLIRFVGFWVSRWCWIWEKWTE